MDKLLYHIIEEGYRISGIVRDNITKRPLPAQIRDYNDLADCPKCHTTFTQRNPKDRPQDPTMVGLVLPQAVVLCATSI